MGAALVVSLAGLTDAGRPGASAFAAALDTRGVPLSMLVRPEPAGAAAARRWLASRPADAIVLHGEDPPELGRHGCFATAHRHEARLRLIGAIRGLAAVGLTSAAFVPPRWSASAGTRLALRELGFGVCAGAGGVHRLSTGELLRGRVLGVGAGGPGLAARWARRGWLVQLVVSVTDLADLPGSGAALDAVDAALRHGAVPLGYPDLAASRLAASA